MSERPTISVYLDECIVDIGYYRNWSGMELLWECCDLAKRLDGCKSYGEIQEHLEKLSEDSGSPACPELSPAFDAPAEDANLVQMCAPLSRSGGHHPDEELMLELESHSEFPIIIDLSRRCFYYGESGFLAEDIKVLGWREWVEDNGADFGYGSWYDYWAAPGMAVSLDDVDAILAWLEADLRDLRVVEADDVSSGELERLAREGDGHVRARIAETTDSESILGILAEDDNAAVRLSVARRAELPENIQCMLAQDGDPRFRERLAEQARSSGILALLASDEDEGVRAHVARNLSTPSDVLLKLAKDDEPSVRLALALSLLLPGAVIRELANDESIEVRRAVARATADAEFFDDSTTMSKEPNPR